MSNKVLAKFTCVANKETTDGYEIKLEPVTCGSVENDYFFNYTPYGLIDLGIVNEDAAKAFLEGKDYYVTFSDEDTEETVAPTKEETFLDRLKSEHHHLNTNCEKLLTFMGSENFSKIDTNQQSLLRQQYEYMTNYLNVLSERLDLLESK